MSGQGTRVPRRYAGLVLLLFCTHLSPAQTSTTVNSVDSEEEESDQAAFTVAVQRGVEAAQCSGALVSERAVLTSAWCALGSPNAPSQQIWVSASTRPRTPDCMRRVVKVSIATGARAEEEGSTAWRQRWGAWGGAVRDLAILELVEGFSSECAVPVIIAPTAANCSAALCYTVLGAPRGVLTIEPLTADRTACASAAPYWPAVRDNAMCFRGSELCSTEWGAGVVCNGALCGVVSRSARSAVDRTASAARTDPQQLENEPDPAALDCGDIHAVQSIPLWRPFLECAHTLKACGRGQCARICSVRLVSETEMTTRRTLPAAAPTTPRAVEIVTDGNTGVGNRRALSSAAPPRQSPPPRHMHHPRPTMTGARPDEARRSVSVVVMPTLTPSAELLSPAQPRNYEPYRPDFKPGEYGENAMDYSSMDEDAPPPPAPQALSSPRATFPRRQLPGEHAEDTGNYMQGEGEAPAAAYSAVPHVNLAAASPLPQRSSLPVDANPGVRASRPGGRSLEAIFHSPPSDNIINSDPTPIADVDSYSNHTPAPLAPSHKILIPIYMYLIYTFLI